MTSAPAADRRPCRVFGVLTRLILRMIAAVSVATRSRALRNPGSQVGERAGAGCTRISCAARSGPRPFLSAPSPCSFWTGDRGRSQRHRRRRAAVNISGTMERELGLRGVGRRRDYGQLGGMSPAEFLPLQERRGRHRRARMCPARPGARFDVFVRTLPGSSVTSLEADACGRPTCAWAPPRSSARARRARSPRPTAPYINPFSRHAGRRERLRCRRVEGHGDRTFGRVLDGGWSPTRCVWRSRSTTPRTRAWSMVNAINSRFDEPGSATRRRKWTIRRQHHARDARSFAGNLRSSSRRSGTCGSTRRSRTRRAKRYHGPKGAARVFAGDHVVPGGGWATWAQAAGRPVRLSRAGPADGGRQEAARLGDPQLVTPLIEIARSARRRGCAGGDRPARQDAEQPERELRDATW